MASGRYHWSQCAHPARFFQINANASIPWLIVALHPTYTTLGVSAAATAFFVYIEFVKKMNVITYIRSIRTALTGRIKSVKN